MTEVEGKELTEGMRVVIGEMEREAEAGPATDRSPLMPQTQPRQQPRKSPAAPGGER
jgi:hypothetical protein